MTPPPPRSVEAPAAKRYPPQSARPRPGSLERYVVAVGFVAAAVALKSVPPQLGQERPFLLLYVAVILAAWYGGRGPAVVAVALAVVAADYFFLPPYGSLLLTRTAAVDVGLFAVEASVACALTVAMKEARVRAEACALRSQRHEEQLRRLNRAHHALSVSDEALVRAEDDGVLLEEICRAIVEVAGYRMCWVGYAERDEAKTVRPIAQAGYDDGYVQTVAVTWADTERGRGMVGTAIRLARPCVMQDSATDPAFAPWRVEALKRGYASGIGLPLRADGRVFGVLGIYASEKDAFDEEAVRLLVDLANDLSYGLTALRTRARVGEERARFESVVMHAPVAVAVLSGPDHTVRLANPRWLRLGITGDAPVGRPLSAVVREAGAPSIFAWLDEVYVTGEPREVTEDSIEHRRAGGAVDTCFYNVAAEPLRGAAGSVTDIVIALFDVTEQVAARRAIEEARAAAEQASRAKDEFLRIASHELRTPLTPILGWAQTLKTSRCRDPDQLERGLDIILASARAEARLVDDLLDVSRIVAGRMPMEMHPVALGPVVQACVDASQPDAAARGVQIEASIPPDTELVGDPVRLQQVAQNLLSNAIKFTPRGGRVHVEITREKGGLTLRVRDTGKGISPGELARVFDPFHTGDSSLTRAEGGLGLGLFIVRHIVEAHGGTVRAESAGPGRGATFVAELVAPTLPSP
jgi:signal transduction histidine kinase/putative methionine-R-sulfoxide reductase with GAF domain